MELWSDETPELATCITSGYLDNDEFNVHPYQYHLYRTNLIELDRQEFLDEFSKPPIEDSPFYLSMSTTTDRA